MTHKQPISETGALSMSVISTAAELDALPLGSVVIDRFGVARTRRGGDSHMPAGWTDAGRSPLWSSELADGHPMHVVHIPGRNLLAEAWDEGYDAGHQDARAVGPLVPDPTPNPYERQEQGNG